MHKLCIFDMDGTLVNTLDSIAYFANRALNMYGLPSVETEKFKKFVGNGASVLVRRLVTYTGGSDEQFEKVRTLYNKSYDDDFLYLTRAYDGVPEMLKDLRAAGINSAILSNKPDSTAKKVSDALFGKELVDICCGGRDGVRLKPDPQGVTCILSELGFSPDECLYIGDTATDIETAKNSGITSVGVLWGFRDRAELEGAGADYIVSSPDEISEIAKKL